MKASRRERLYQMVIQAKGMMDDSARSLHPNYTKIEMKAHTVKVNRYNRLANAFDNA